ncbi:TIGR02270 family protein [Corallococcus llansteffanensis]|uniref:TIGR02270 family protein n=1 Tax=Corallococcus llansteffanensis TaxID=2316731 RepID=A0A3A8QIW0_9BACT|nr:TIGR02270 family protein [Corallococcus llansteffanensis]RKH68643.1 TIGR02270 family protein [Corallococcus llansteffanensis]
MLSNEALRGTNASSAPHDASPRMDMARDFLADAAFFWVQREQGLVAPDYTLQELLEGPEQRLLACLDALVLGGPTVTRKLLRPALVSEEFETVACAGSALLMQGGAEELDAVLTALCSDVESTSQGAARSLELTRRVDAVPRLHELLRDATPRVLARVLAILTQWQADPAQDLDGLLAAGHAPLACAVLRAARRFPARLKPASIERALGSDVPEVRNVALETAFLLGHPGAWSTCVEAVRRQGPGWGGPASLLALGGDPQDVELLLQALPEPALRRDALWALGLCGRVAAVGPLLEAMRDETVAPMAAEAFCAITGLALTGDLKVSREAWTPEAPEEEATPLGPEAALPFPMHQRVEHWWKEAQRRFTPQGRYLAGKPFGAEPLLEALTAGPMRRRATLALELAVRTQGAWQLSTGNWALRQWRELQAMRPAVRGSLALGSFRALPRTLAVPDALPVKDEPLFAPVFRQRPPPPGALAVTGLGLVSSLGDGVVGSCAAARVGVARPGAMEGTPVVDEDSGEELPVTGHAIPHLTQGFSGVGRLVRMGEAALADLVHQTGLAAGPRTGLFLNLPSGFLLAAAERHAREAAKQEAAASSQEEDAAELEVSEEEPLLAEVLRERYSRTLLPRLLAQAQLPGGVSQEALFFGDSPGFVTALHAAERALSSGAVDRCIVGGIDSLVEPEWLDALEELRLLKTPNRHVGLMPGECAAFVLVEKASTAARRGAPVHAYIDALASASEPAHMFSGQPHLGVALTSVLAEVLGNLEDRGQETGLVFADLDGTMQRAQDWGYAQVRMDGFPLRELPQWTPVDAWGGVGAATGALAVCMAARSFARGHAPASGVLAWLWGGSGERAALHVRAPTAR